MPIQLMIVVLIIGGLTALSIALYQNYVAKSQIVAVVFRMASYPDLN